MPTTTRAVPASDSFAPDPCDPQAPIERTLRRTRAELEVVLEEVVHARSVGLRLELVDRALRLHFLSSRLQFRLAMLGDGGLLAMSAIREADVGAIVRNCAAEVALECQRRQIALDVHIDSALRSTWLDADQFSEAIRCLIDDAMEALQEHGTLSLEARADARGLSIVMRDDRCQSRGAATHAVDLALVSRFAEALDAELARRPVGPGVQPVTETVLWIPDKSTSELSETTAPRSNAA